LEFGTVIIYAHNEILPLKPLNKGGEKKNTSYTTKCGVLVIHFECEKKMKMMQ